MIRAFYADVSCFLNEDFFGKAFFLLPPKIQGKIKRIKPALNKCQSLGAWILLEHYFKKHPEYDFEKEISTEKTGKPYFKNCSSLHFSFSHSENIALCAVSSSRIGADVQAVCKFDEKICERYFSKEEYSYVISADSDKEKEKRFAMVWAHKEAYVKMTGEGIFGIKKISLPIINGILGYGDSDGFFRGFEEDDFSFAFCTENKEDDFEIKKINFSDLLIN